MSHWRFHLGAYLPGSQRQWDLREGYTAASGGHFSIEVPDGQYEISVSVDCGQSSVVLGWYGGESGFTTAYDEVTYVAVEGVDVSGVAIALPEDPSAYHGLCDPRPLHIVSGVVSDSSGDPLPGFEVTAYNVTSNRPVYGPTITHSPDSTFVAEDGSFILEVPDGSYDVRVYERCGRLLGSYDIQLDSFHDPFSGVRAQWVENLVVVQGEDITGIVLVIPDRPGALEGLTLREWLAARGADCPQPVAPAVHISLLGGFVVAVDGTDREVSDGARRLAAYTARRPRHAARSLVSGALRPGLNRVSAGRLLHEALRRLPATASPSIVESNRTLE